MPLLRVRLGNRLTVGGTDPEGRVEVEVAGPLGRHAGQRTGRIRRLDCWWSTHPRRGSLLAGVAGELRRLYGEPDPDGWTG